MKKQDFLKLPHKERLEFINNRMNPEPKKKFQKNTKDDQEQTFDQWLKEALAHERFIMRYTASK